MAIRKLLTWLLFALLGLMPNRHFGESLPKRIDSTFINKLLEKGQAIEQTQADSALVYYRRGLALSQKIGYKTGYFNSVRYLAYTLTTIGRPREARLLAQTALNRARRDTSNLNLAICYFSLATAAYAEGGFKEAIQNYQQAAQAVQRLNNPARLWSIYNNIGLIYKEQKLYPQALAVFERVIQIQRTTETKAVHQAMAYLNAADVHYRMGQVDAAKRYYRQIPQLIDPRKDLDLMTLLSNNLGEIFYDEGQFDSSFVYHRRALSLSRQIGNPLLETHELMALGRIRNHLKQYRQARPLLAQALQLARQTADEDPTELKEIYEQYEQLDRAEGNYRAAHDWLSKHEALEDTLENHQTKTLLQEYELKIKQAEAGQKLAEKQRQINQLQEERQRQNLWLLVAALAAVVVAVGLVLGSLYFRQRQRTAAQALLATERERQLALVQSELQGQQKERLRISKEMHDDLGASLTAIGLLSEVLKSRLGTAITPEVEKISSISAEMVTAMNEIIWSLNTKNDSLNGLIAYTRSYAREFIDNTALTLQTQVEESPREITIRGADRRNVFLTVKEALNNTVKHAKATQVTLTILPQPDRLEISVGDNGRGFVANGQTNLRNGLGNMRNRMAESGGTCEIISSPTGTCVKISYPYPAVPSDKILQT